MSYKPAVLVTVLILSGAIGYALLGGRGGATTPPDESVEREAFPTLVDPAPGHLADVVASGGGRRTEDAAPDMSIRVALIAEVGGTVVQDWTGTLTLRSSSGAVVTRAVADGRIEQAPRADVTCTAVSSTSGEYEIAASVLDASSGTLWLFGYDGLLVDSSACRRGPVECFVRDDDPTSSEQFDVPYAASLLRASSRVSVGENLDYCDVDFASEFVFLRSEGTAWERWSTTSLEVGQVLSPACAEGGAVLFTVSGAEVPRRGRMVVRGPGGTKVMTPPFHAVEGAVVEGWTPGPYQAYISLGGDLSVTGRSTEVVEFEVVAGNTERVELELYESVGAPSLGSVSGELHFEAWPLVEPVVAAHGLRIRFQPVGGSPNLAFDALPVGRKIVRRSSMKPGPTRFGGSPSYVWSAPDFPAGTYIAHIEPTGAFVPFEVREGENTHLDAPIPELAAVSLTLERDGSPLSPEALFVSQIHASVGETALSPTIAVTEIEGGIRMFTAMPHETMVTAVSTGQSAGNRMDLRPGWNDCVINFPLGMAATLELVDASGSPFSMTSADWLFGCKIRGEIGHLRVDPVSCADSAERFCSAEVAFQVEGSAEVEVRSDGHVGTLATRWTENGRYQIVMRPE
ncbi:MAG: hypothetical protein AAFP22_03130 [Planctomycetota bacterium]